MPGAIPHIIAGFTLFIIGKYYYKNFFNEGNKSKKLFILLFICLSFSFIPDFLLIIYYTTYSFSFCGIIPYHNLLHIILFIIATIVLLVIKFFLNIKSEPIWTMGLLAIIIHPIMDLIIPDTGIWI